MYYAYYDKNDNSSKIDAKDVKAVDQRKVYYCPGCKCPMGFRSNNSNKIRPTFFKLPSSKHSPGCFVPYVQSEGSNIEDFDTSKFNPEELLSNLTSRKKADDSVKKSKTKTNPSNNDKNERKEISTIRQLYYMCASNAPNKIIKPDLRVEEIFAGRNTARLYCKYISGVKLVECVFLNRYDNEKKYLVFGFPFGKDTDTIKLKVYIPDEELFKKTKKQLWEYKNPVIIYSTWNGHSCEISSDKQIVPLKKV